jgi:hypothetical protein
MDHYRQVITKNKPASPKSGQVAGTWSQFIKIYSDSGDPILMVHQFVRPDGTLGASGKPDPKMILFEGIEYFCG